MSREIKFDYIFKNDHGEFFHYKTPLHRIDKGMENICDMWGVVPFIAVRQFTGLKDKNGVEIYEGDIIKCVMCSNHYGDERDNIVFAIDIEFQTGLETEFSGGPDGQTHYKDIEIIGNIHENKDIL